MESKKLVIASSGGKTFIGMIDQYDEIEVMAERELILEDAVLSVNTDNGTKVSNYPWSPASPITIRLLNIDWIILVDDQGSEFVNVVNSAYEQLKEQLKSIKTQLNNNENA